MSVLIPAILVCDSRHCRRGEAGQPKQENVLLRRRASKEGTWLDVPYGATTWRVVTAGVHACCDDCQRDTLTDTPAMPRL